MTPHSQSAYPIDSSVWSSLSVHLVTLSLSVSPFIHWPIGSSIHQPRRLSFLLVLRPPTLGAFIHQPLSPSSLSCSSLSLFICSVGRAVVLSDPVLSTTERRNSKVLDISVEKHIFTYFFADLRGIDLLNSATLMCSQLIINLSFTNLLI